MSALVGMAVAEGKLDTGATLAALGIDEKGHRSLPPSVRRASPTCCARGQASISRPLAKSSRCATAADARQPPARNPLVLQQLGLQRPRHDLPARDRRGHLQAIDRRIAKPIGMQDFRAAEGSYYLEEQYSEHPGYIFRISARDLARFGVLYLNRGRWGTTQLIPASWVDASVRSYSPSGDQGSARHEQRLRLHVVDPDERGGASGAANSRRQLHGERRSAASG